MQANWFDWRHASPEDRKACRRLIRQGSKSFFAASLLLPADLRDPAYAIYAFCRLADDRVDLGIGGADPIALLQRRLDAVYGEAPHDLPSDRALTDVVGRHQIPRELFDALLEGLAWDQTGRSYETIEDLHDYAARVASAVGAIMTCLMGRRSPATLARACDLGVAMQLTNIARDVGEDARAGRLYLPRTWLREAGIDPEAFLADPRPGPELAAVVARLLAHADGLYQRAGAGIADLPWACRPAINAARLLYRGIGQVVGENRHDSVSTRAVVATHRKLGLVLRAMLEAPLIAGRPAAPPLEATQFLVDAVRAGSAAGLDQGFDSRTEWVIDLFSQLRERDRVKDTPATAT